MKLTIEEIDDIRQSPRSFVSLDAIEHLSDTAMIQDMEIKILRKELRIMTTKCIAQEEIGRMAVKSAMSWPASWAKQPSADEFISMALKSYEEERLLDKLKEQQ
jgi:hypothetical protein